MKWPLQKSYEDIIACDKKSKETKASLFLCIQGVDNCDPSIIVENAIVLVKMLYVVVQENECSPCDKTMA